MQTGQADYFREQIAPHIDDQRVRYVGEVSGAPEKQLYARAAAMLMPIRWNEPFGMVMVEALACGTPVIAFAEGAAEEIVIDGDNGMLVADEADMARVHEIDPARCRESARARYDVAITADCYETVYDRAARVRTPLARSRDNTPLVARQMSAPATPPPRRASEGQSKQVRVV